MARGVDCCCCSLVAVEAGVVAVALTVSRWSCCLLVVVTSSLLSCSCGLDIDDETGSTSLDGLVAGGWSRSSSFDRQSLALLVLDIMIHNAPCCSICLCLNGFS